MEELELSRILTNKRKETGMSLRQASEYIGVSYSYLSNLEKGNNTNPSLKILKRISNGYNLDYIYLLKISGHEKTAMFIEEGELNPSDLIKPPLIKPEFDTEHDGTIRVKRLPLDFFLLGDENIEVYFNEHQLSDEDRKTIYKIIKELLIYKYK